MCLQLLDNQEAGMAVPLRCNAVHIARACGTKKNAPDRDHDVAFAMIATREITKRHSSDDVAPAGTAATDGTFAF
jgi:hypothetical protein